jgi:hypothetical protein
VFNHWVTILLTIAAVGGAIATIIGWFRAPIRWWRSRKKKALSFAQNDVFCFWSVGKLSDQSEPVTLVSGRWRVTNSSDRDVKITNVRLSKYVHQSARLAMRNPEDERNIFVYGNFPIATHQTLEVEVVLTFFPSIGRAPEPIISDVIFTDNFENQHSVRSKFTYESKPAPKSSQRPFGLPLVPT